jgi:hypothetical protein
MFVHAYLGNFDQLMPTPLLLLRKGLLHGKIQIHFLSNFFLFLDVGEKAVQKRVPT